MVVGRIFENAAEAVPHRVAAVAGDAALTFGQIDRLGNQVAHALRAKGLGLGDRVLCWTETTLDVVPVFVAAAKLGVVFAPINGRLGIDETARMVEGLAPSLVLVDADRREVGAELAARLGVGSLVITGLASSDHDLWGSADAPPTTAPGEEGLTEHDAHVIFFTSGSTGKAKGVVLSHRVSTLRSHPGALLEPRGAAICPYPLFHMGAWTQGLQQWHARDTAVFTAGDAVEICQAIERYAVTRINCIPAVWRRVLDHVADADAPSYDLTSVRFADSGTSATPPELLDSITSALPNAQVRVFYGATETGAVTTLEDSARHRKPGSVGTVAPMTEVRIAADGELQVRGPTVFEGYFANPEATGAAFDGEWYRTGDCAEMDDDGFVSIVGRRNDLIRTGGESVVPAEVEAVLEEHPAIAEVAVVGLPDADWGELVCAAIVLRPGPEAPPIESLVALCRDRLASYKHPRRMIVLDRLPRTPATQQVQRQLILNAVAG